jgi:hypothetical protein
MQYVNDDMDELFRKAAQNYPLDTRSGDWSKVLNALEGTDEPKPEPKSGRGRFLWLLLLAPFTLICNNFQNGKNDLAKNDVQKTGNEKQLTQHNTSSQAATPNPDATNIVNPELFPDKSSEQHQRQNSDDPQLHSVGHKGGSEKKQVVKGQTFYTAGHFSKTKKAEKDFSATNANIRRTVSAESEQFSGNREAVPGLAIFKRTPLVRLSPDKHLLELLPVSETVSSKKSQSSKSKKFYVGLMGGVDLTTIKFQKIEEAGYDYGVLLGYQFAPKWSVETGLFMDKKFYYSKGEYFNTSKMYLPPNSKILEVSGNCDMYEIPLNVRYNFSSSAKRTWFATAGASSYLMKKEDYGYLYYYGSSGTTAMHYKQYENASSHFFSVAQFSGGYTHKIGKIGDLRIEPYVKVPLAGMGTGNVPLFSTGIHLGITRKLF